jgi:hypothetical protein
LDASDLDLRRVVRTTWDAVGAYNAFDARIFKHGSGDLVEVYPPHQGSARLHLFTEHSWRARLADVCRWVQPKDVEPADALPPLHVVRAQLAVPRKPVPQITQLVHTPIYAPDGTLIQTAGYHAISGIYYEPEPGFGLPEPVPEVPTPRQVRRALWWLREAVRDFPFREPADLANAISLALERFCRPLVDGPTPLRLIAKPAAGTGAGLLVSTLLLPALGQLPASTTETDAEDEWRKKLSSIVRAGKVLIYLGNLHSELGSAALSELLTQTWWSDRVLGISSTFEAPVHQTFVATGNNPKLSEELSRRTVYIWLDANVAHPEDRAGWRRTLPRWAQTHRPRLVWSALVIIQSWLAAGRPAADVPAFGSYEAWSAVHGGILAHASNVASLAERLDFLGNLHANRVTSNQDQASRRAFYGLWWDKHRDQKVVTSVLVPLAEQSEYVPIHEALLGVDLEEYDAIPSEQRMRIRKQQGDRLSHLLQAEADRVIDLAAEPGRDRPTEVKLRALPERLHGRRVWQLVRHHRPAGSSTRPFPVSRDEGAARNGVAGAVSASEQGGWRSGV